MKAIELGCAGHFIAAKSCHFRRHTQIGDRFRVSSVGDYFPVGAKTRATIGAGPDAFFETMVFRTAPRTDGANEGCGCREVTDYSGLECVRYSNAGDAQAGHERMVAKYRRMK